MMMSVDMKPGMWKRRDGLAVTVRPFQDGGWIGSDGHHRWNDGLYRRGTECVLDLVEFLGELEPEPQSDAVDELAELKDDRDRWQTRAKQAEGRIATLTQDLATTTANRDGLGRRIHELENDRDKWRRRVAELERQVGDLQAQLEAAAHSPDLSADLERVAAERDAAREEVRGLQVRAEQAEGDARQATAKLGNLQGEVVRLTSQLKIKTDTLLAAQAANDALQVVILNLFREVRGDE